MVHEAEQVSWSTQLQGCMVVCSKTETLCGLLMRGSFSFCWHETGSGPEFGAAPHTRAQSGGSEAQGEASGPCGLHAAAQQHQSHACLACASCVSQ